jgi:membrane associated rhomboid family serine protease
MLVVIPIRTESEIRRTPAVNYALIGINVLLFLVFNVLLGDTRVADIQAQYLSLQSDQPAFYQFVTYQFFHADAWHLLGNLLFLWVFGNSVNAKMGDVPYLLFYVAGGIFAAWAYALVTPAPSRLVGASGAIAAVTTAYLALFPRSRVTVLVWVFILIHFFELPAMVIIGLKIIVWDNIIAPSFGGHEAIAYTAHLGGYFFGFVGALGLLLVRGLPRDQFDILALWKRWHQRRQLAAALSDPASAARAQFGTVARPITADPERQAAEERRFDRIADLRSRISEAMERRDVAAAGHLYGELIAIDPAQCLSERHQLGVAREFYDRGRAAEAAAAFDRFVACYPDSPEAGNVRLLLGIIYARDLRDYNEADTHLSALIGALRDQTRRDQCLHWLKIVRAALGRPAPEGEPSVGGGA